MIFEIVKFRKFFFQSGKPKFDSKNWQILLFEILNLIPKHVEFG